MEIDKPTIVVIVVVIIALGIFIWSMGGGGAESVANIPVQAMGGGCGR